MFYKLLICTCFIFSLSYTAFAQDIVVTTKGDTLNCRITKITAQNIHIDYVRAGKIYSTILPDSQIKFYKKGVSEVTGYSQAVQPQPVNSWNDTIITVKGDTVLGEITKVTADKVYFKYKRGGKSYNSILPKTYIKSYEKDANKSAGYLRAVQPQPVSYWNDTIITVKGDTVLAKITRITNDKVHFKYKREGKILHTVFPKTYLKSYKKGAYVAVNQDSYTTQTGNPTTGAIFLGLAYRLGATPSNIPSALEEHIRKLRRGLSIGLDINHIANGRSGFGFNFRLLSRAVKDAALKSNVTILYIGPSYAQQSFLKDGRVTLTFGLGYMSLVHKITDQGSSFSNSATARGNTVGALLSVGRDLNLTDTNVKMRFQFSLILGAVSDFDISSGGSTSNVQASSNEERESLAQLNFGIGFSF